MTRDMMTLQTLLANTPDADLLREMIGFAAQRLMELEDKTGAAHCERSPARLTQRNGYRDRFRETRASTVELRIPKVGQDTYFPESRQSRQMSETTDSAPKAPGR